MNIINAEQKTSFVVQTKVGKKKEHDNVKYFEKNPNGQILYKDLKSEYFNSQKYAIKRQKSSSSDISFKSHVYYHPSIYKTTDNVVNDNKKFNCILQAIFECYLEFFQLRGIDVDNADIVTLCSYSFLELEKSRKNFEKAIEYNDGSIQLQKGKNDSVKQQKNIINKNIDVLKKDKISKSNELIKFKDLIQNELSTESFMNDQFSCLSLFIDYYPKMLTIHDNISKIIILDYMKKNKAAFKLDNIIGKTILSINTEPIVEKLAPYIYAFSDLPDYKDIANNFFMRVIDFIVNYIIATTIEMKLKLIDDAIIKQKEQLTKLEYKEPEISEEERNKLLEEILLEESQNNIELKAQKGKSVKKKNRKKQIRSQIHNIHTKQDISSKQDYNMLLDQAFVNKTFVKEEKCLDIVDESEIGKEKFLLKDKVVNLINGKHLIQDLRYNFDDIEHEYNIVSEELTNFFFNKLMSSNKLHKQVCDKISDAVFFSNQHFVGSFLCRFQEENKDATLEDCVNACIEILNDGAILHSSTQRDKTKLELYLPKYKMTIPFSLNYDTNKIYFKTMFMQKDIQNCRRAVQNPANKDKYAYSWLSGMHAYLTLSQNPQYYTLNDSFNVIKELHERKYSI